MKILAVRFLNLNSLKGEHEIRFDQSPLADAGLFAITGPTGAGKTTVLDAITVGLYGLAHRHSNDKPLELMTRHTAECYSEVEFEANGKVYRSKWHLRRSRGKVEGKIQAVHMELYDFDKDELFDLKPSQVPDKVAEICGLDYSQFLRSVMLSQGDFARFLKANPNERSSLLEKITDTGIYSDISRFAYEKARTERQKREELERSLQDSKLLPEEQRQGYEQGIAEFTAQEKTLTEEVNQVQEKRQWLQQIQQLQQRAALYKENLQAQEEKLTAMKPQFMRLEQHEQANHFVGELTQIRVASGHLTEVQQQLATLEKQLPVLEAELEQAGQIAQETTKSQQQQEEALQQLEPLLTQVQQLDHQLQTVRELFRTAKDEYTQLDMAAKNEQSILNQKEVELNTLTQKASAHKKWLQEHARLKDLREHLHVFRQAVKDLGDTERNISSLQREQEAINRQLQAEARQLSAIVAAQQEQQAQQTALEGQKQEKLSQLQSVLADKSLEDLEKLNREQPVLQSRYERLLEFSKAYTLQQQKAAQLNGQSEQLKQQITLLSTKIGSSQEQHALAHERLTDLQRLVTLQQRIQELEHYRTTLQPEQPCPLCGSEHHPYAAGHYTSTLSEEEQRRDAQLALVKELETGINSLQLQLNTFQTQQENTLSAKVESDSELARLYQSYTLLAQEIAIAITETDKLTQLLQAQRETQNSLDQKLETARKTSRQAELITQELQKLREAQLQAQAQLSKLQQSDEMLQQQLQRYTLQLQDLQEQQQAFLETAQSFAASYTLNFVPEKRQELLQQLEGQANAYQQQHEAYEALRDPFLQLQEQVKNLKEKLAEREQHLKDRKEALAQLHLQLTALKEKRTQLFGDKDPQQERQAAQHNLRRQAQQAEAARATLQKKQQELQEQRQRQQECNASHTHKKSELDNLRDGLLRVLRQQGIETIEALSQMLLHRDEADRLANQKAHTEKQLTELRKSLSDVLQDLAQAEARQLTSESMEALQQQLTAKTEAMRGLISSRARMEQLLEQDRQQRDKNLALAEKLRVQQQECNRWDQLATLIGSADGNKFSRFAQGLTLARLVELANRHLLKLNDRYRILKSTEEDLELLIVDTYQAETIRPMNTLSGGESFLVSLALALGLSDLAGRRTQINSLFIDEGFGTLDADTLDAAVSTLENLHAAGKMIGIISHVEALKERISTQIVITKQAGGVSTVKVTA
ncbi:AAA family ATPase [Pontibacter sp. JH31]|uniref:AAA family ATPase n=1 Tax=Pontibacter aquaedesilientis TaxID=2766980 RepID=A0ABR7XFK5_9BACT|nr:AAA family ATPase [Pontibacter aquaedesilientis]MBD1397070.1 AAA family ATPase [Pontibacter aquaedesilientis]